MGRCWEAGGAPPYWPWVQCFRAYVRSRNSARLSNDLGTGAADVARIVPEIRDVLPDLPEPPPLSPESARFRLFDSTAALLQRAAGTQPILIVLDDLHAADIPSLLLLRFLGREMDATRLLIAAAYRDKEMSDAMKETISDLTRLSVTRRLNLGRLREIDVGTFIEGASGTAQSPKLTAAVYQQTEGNPLFVDEVVRLLAFEERLGDLDPRTGHLAVPQGVRAVIGRRLERLSAPSKEILAPAAVLGREFDLEALLKATGREAAAVLQALDEASTEGVVSEVPGTPGRFRFSHQLMREGTRAASRGVRLPLLPSRGRGQSNRVRPTGGETGSRRACTRGGCPPLCHGAAGTRDLEGGRPNRPLPAPPGTRRVPGQIGGSPVGEGVIPSSSRPRKTRGASRSPGSFRTRIRRTIRVGPGGKRSTRRASPPRCAVGTR